MSLEIIAVERDAFIKNRYTKRASSWLARSLRWLFIFALAGLAACSAPPRASQTAGALASPAPVTSTPQPTILPSPSPTAQPRAVLLLPAGADPEQAAALQALLAELAAASGLDFQSLLATDALGPGVRVALAVPPDPGLAALAAAAPQTSFLALGIPDLQAAPNLIAVNLAPGQPEQQGFLAGYLAALVTPDWRVGVISSDDPAGASQRQGFLNGVVFYCGLCRPAYPPFVQYPASVALPGGSSQADQQAAADSLIAQGVATVYVAPGAGDASLLDYLAGQGVNLIGGEAPPASLQEHWVATISTDWQAAVRQAWAKVVGGEITPAASPPLAISQRNEALFSSGRLRLAEQIRDELAAGLIDPGAGEQ